MANNLPHVRQSIVGGDGIATQPWYAWFGRIQSALNAGTISDDEAAAAITAIATALGSPDGTVANIPALNFLPKTTTVTGSATVDVDGSLAGGGVTLSVPDDAITNAKLANMAASTIKARKTGSTGDPEDCTITEVLDFVAGTPTTGDLIVRDAAAMARIAAGTAGHVLTSNGAGALPTYQAAGGGGGGGAMLGYAMTSSTTSASTGAVIPIDNTIPQSGEGTAYASLDTTYTPISSTSQLEVEVTIPWVTNSNSGQAITLALFRDAGANAIAVSYQNVTGASGVHGMVVRAVVPSTATTATTFSLRWGVSSNTGYIMRTGGVAAYFGGVLAATMTVKEFA